MKKAFRVFLALAILSVGTGIALLHRLESTATAPASPGGESEAMVEEGAEGPGAGSEDSFDRSKASDRDTRRLAAGSGADSASDYGRRIEPASRPAQSHADRRSSLSAASRQEGVRNTFRPTDAPLPARTHEVADGDTLQGIARKYLGSASLAGEIFEANRTRLTDPALLQIGEELVIPAGVPRTSTPSDSPRREPLVRVAPSRPSLERDQAGRVVE